MTPVNRPYFLNNEEWYYIDYKENKFKLTTKANQKAIESYKEFYKMFKSKTQ